MTIEQSAILYKMIIDAHREVCNDSLCGAAGHYRNAYLKITELTDRCDYLQKLLNKAELNCFGNHVPLQTFNELLAERDRLVVELSLAKAGTSSQGGGGTAYADGYNTGEGYRKKGDLD